MLFRNLKFPCELNTILFPVPQHLIMRLPNSPIFASNLPLLLFLFCKEHVFKLVVENKYKDFRLGRFSYYSVLCVPWTVSFRSKAKGYVCYYIIVIYTTIFMEMRCIMYLYRTKSGIYLSSPRMYTDRMTKVFDYCNAFKSEM